MSWSFGGFDSPRFLWPMCRLVLGGAFPSVLGTPCSQILRVWASLGNRCRYYMDPWSLWIGAFGSLEPLDWSLWILGAFGLEPLDPWSLWIGAFGSLEPLDWSLWIRGAFGSLEPLDPWSLRIRGALGCLEPLGQYVSRLFRARS